MREKLNDSIENKAQTRTSPKPSAPFVAFSGYWKAYWKLGLGMLLVVLLVVFVVQNANTIHVRFLAWEADMSQALVVFLAMLSGVVLGVAFARWQRWRSTHVQR
jgi:uncharacterized integral membrane protein